MPRERRRFQRASGERRYRRVFLIATEGAKTEVQYFMMLNGQHAAIQVSCLRGTSDSAPLRVLKRMKRRLRSETLRPSDEAWLVVDKDQWTDEHLGQLYAWARERENRGLALSNPMFEYWLLLHFDDGVQIASSRECRERLRRFIPETNKDIDARRINRDRIEAAIRRAKARDNPPCSDWPRTPGGTTVYRLVERILGAEP